jgi:anti-anti-sigma factor
MREGFEVSQQGDNRAFSLAGELDIGTAPVLEAAVEPLLGQPGSVVFDLQGLTFADSTGLRVFLRVAGRLGGGGRVVLVSPQPTVRRILDLTQMSRLMDIRYDSAEAAAQADELPSQP